MNAKEKILNKIKELAKTDGLSSGAGNWERDNLENIADKNIHNNLAYYACMAIIDYLEENKL